MRLTRPVSKPVSKESPFQDRKGALTWEPPIGIEPMTYALRGACGLAAHALAAPMAPVIALMTLAALGLSRDPVHEPVHARRPRLPFLVTGSNNTESVHPHWEAFALRPLRLSPAPRRGAGGARKCVRTALPN
jgi:hypothetical protein